MHSFELAIASCFSLVLLSSLPLDACRLAFRDLDESVSSILLSSPCHLSLLLRAFFFALPNKHDHSGNETCPSCCRVQGHLDRVALPNIG